MQSYRYMALLLVGLLLLVVVAGIANSQGITTRPADPTKPGATKPPASQPGAGAGPTTQPASEQRRQACGKSDMMLLVAVGGMMLVMFFFSSRSRRKQAAKRKEMLGDLKKGDKVTTAGGVIGTVIEVREEHVTVKVDETNNVRMKFLRRAIQSVGDEGRSEDAKDSK